MIAFFFLVIISFFNLPIYLQLQNNAVYNNSSIKEIAFNVQSGTDGYIVLNSGDTLIGHIRKPAASFLLHHQITFWPKNEKDSYKFEPNELKAFKIGEEVFVSHYIWSGQQLIKKFLKPVVTGYCTLYEYHYTKKTSRGMRGQPVRRYYVERSSERLHTLDFTRLKRGKDLFFADNQALTFDIQSGRYSEKELPEIVKRYNSESVRE